MDRREALKKLAAGGAVAGVGSVVLSSREVAYAMSGCSDLVGAPVNGTEPPVLFSIVTNKKSFTLAEGSGPVTCTGGGSASISYTWTATAQSTPLILSNDSSAQITVRRADGKGFKRSDTYTIELDITWQCPCTGPGTGESLRVTYNFTTSDAQVAPSISQTSYTLS